MTTADLRPLRLPKTPTTGVAGLQFPAADAAVLSTQPFQTPPVLSAPAAPPAAAAPAAPDIFFSPSTGKMAVGGTVFDQNDAAAALQSPAFASRKAPPPTGIASDWLRVDPAGYDTYLRSFATPLSVTGNIAAGAQSLGEGLVGGVGRGLQLAGADKLGGAIADFADKHIGLSPSQEARLGAVSKGQGLAGKIATATLQSIPSIGAAVGGGLAGGAFGGPVGAVAGVAASILPLELQQAWDVAEQNGHDTSDPSVQTDILLTSIFNTGIQTVGPTIIARGFSPALRGVVGDAVKRTMGGRIARGVGTGALEGSSEAIAQVTDQIMFDPELRAKLNDADIAALAPLVAQRYGTDALVAFGAGFALGAPLGAVHVQGASQDATGVPDAPPRPKRNTDTTAPVDLLNGVETQTAAAPLPLADATPRPAGLLPPPALVTPPPVNAAPTVRAGRPVSQSDSALITPPLQSEMFRASEMGQRATQPAPAADGALAPVAGQTQPSLPLQSEMFRASEMGQRAAQPAPVAPVMQPGPAQPELPINTFAAAPATQTSTAIADQLTPLLARQAEMRKAQEIATAQDQHAQQQAAEIAARRQQEFEQAQQQAQQQARDALLQAEAAWEQMRPPESRVTFDRLTPKARLDWTQAVAGGSADEALFKKLKRRVRPGKAQPLLDQPTILPSPTQPNPSLAVANNENPAATKARLEKAFAPKAAKLKATPKPKAPKAAKLKATLKPKAPKAAKLKATPKSPVTVVGSKRRSLGVNEGSDHILTLSDGKTVAIRREAAAQANRVPGWYLEGFTPEPNFTGPLGNGYLGNTLAEAKAEVARLATEGTLPPEAQPAKGTAKKPVPNAGASKPERRVLLPPKTALAEYRAKLDTQRQLAARRKQAGGPEAPLTDREFLDEAIGQAEVANTSKRAVHALEEVIFWSKMGDNAVRLHAKEFLVSVQNDPNGAAQVRDAEALYELRREDAHAAEAAMRDTRRLAPGFDYELIASTIDAINAGKTRNLSAKARSALRDAWRRIKDSNPQYGDGPMSALLSPENPEFFHRGARDANGIRPVVSKDTGRNKLDSYNDISSPIKMGRARLVVGRYIKKLARRPKVRLYRNVAHLRKKDPHLYKAANAARPQGDFAASKAAGYSFGDGHVFLFTDNIADEAHARAVLAHETIGHFGLRGVIPATKFNTMMQEIYDGSPAIRHAADAAVETAGMSRPEAVEEYLADFAAALDSSLLARIWAALKTALNRAGFGFSDDAARYLVSHARRYVRNGGIGAMFDNVAIARSLHDMETGAATEAAVGRYMPANSLHELGFATGLMNGKLPPLSKDNLLSSFHNVTDLLDRMKSHAFALTNYRAKENPGLSRYYDIIMSANRQAMSTKTKANEALAGYLNPQLDLKLVKIGDGVTTTQKKLLDSMLYAGQRLAVSRYTPDTSAKKPKLIDLVDGKIVENAAYLKKLQQAGHMALEDFRKGFTYTVFDEAPLTPELTAKLEAARDAAIAKAASPSEKAAIRTDYAMRIDSGVFLEERTEKFPALPHLTEKSLEWKFYKRAREQMDKVEMDLLRAKYIAHLKVTDTQLLEINDAMGGAMTPEDRAFLLDMNSVYRDLYNAGSQVASDGQIIVDTAALDRANQFLADLNAALIATRGSDRNAKVKGWFTGKRADEVAANIEQFKTRFHPSEDQKFVIQNKMKELAVSEISRNDGSQRTEQSIATGYVPVLREGRIQVRMVAIDPATGKELRMKDSFSQQLSYHQVDTVGEAATLRDKINEVFGGTDNTYQVAVWDGDMRGYRVRDVHIKAVADHAVTLEAAPPQLNLNEFLIGLRRFSIPIPPKKMEELVITMTRQNSRARNRLMRAFQPGASPNAAKAISGHIESRAATIAKTIIRPDLDQLMNMSLSASRRLWNANDTELLGRLKASHAALSADPNASESARVEAKRALRTYQFQQKRTARPGTGGVSMAQRYYAEAARSLAFMESQRNLDESDFGSGAVASAVRGAASAAQLGGSIATGSLNVVSVITNTVPYLASYNGARAFGGGFNYGPTITALFRAMRTVGTVGMVNAKANTARYYFALAEDSAGLKKADLTADEALFLAHEIEEGIAIPALSNALIASARGRMTNVALQKFLDFWLLPFNRTEQASRRAVLLASYRLQFDRARQAGQPMDIAMARARKFAVTTVEDTLGEYAVSNRPALWRGGVQQFMYMYKIYPTMTVHLLRNLPRKSQLIFLGGMLGLSGVAGLPFAQDMEDVVDTLAARLGLKTPSIRLKIAEAMDSVVPGWSSILTSGAINTVLPGDFGARTSLGDMFPGTGMFLPNADTWREGLAVAGPAAGAIAGLLTSGTEAAQWAAHAVGLTQRPASLLTAARKSPVTMVRAWADAYAYHETGAVVDKRGYHVTQDASAAVIMARALGFYPSAAAQQYGVIRVAQRLSNYQRDTAATFYNAYVQASLRGDTAAMVRIVREVHAWNKEARGTGLEVRNFQKNAAARVRAAKQTVSARTLKYSPKSTRAQYERAATLLGY